MSDCLQCRDEVVAAATVILIVSVSRGGVNPRTILVTVFATSLGKTKNQSARGGPLGNVYVEVHLRVRPSEVSVSQPTGRQALGRMSRFPAEVQIDGSLFP